MLKKPANWGIIWYRSHLLREPGNNHWRCNNLCTRNILEPKWGPLFLIGVSLGLVLWVVWPSKNRGHLIHLGSGHIGRQDFHASLILFLVTFHLFYAKSASKRHHSIIISTGIWLAHFLISNRHRSKQDVKLPKGTSGNWPTSRSFESETANPPRRNMSNRRTAATLWRVGSSDHASPP